MHESILHIVVNGWFVGQETAGSGQYVERILEHLAGQLAQQGRQYHFTVLVPQARAAQAAETLGAAIGTDISAGGDSPVLRSIHVYPASLMPWPSQLAKLWWEQVTVPRLARGLGGKVLFVPYWAAPLWQPVPTVVTVHDLIPLLLPAYRGGCLNRLYTCLVSWTAQRSAHVLTVSKASRSDIITELGIPGERVSVIHHGPNVEEALARSNVRRSWPHTFNRSNALPNRYFLYLGGFDVRKNLERTLRAYARFLQKGGDTEIKLVVAGRLPDQHTEFAPDPRLIASDLGLEDQVHFVGWVDEADKGNLYAGATAFLFPSLYEGFGMMILEAMSAGTAVITSKQVP